MSLTLGELYAYQEQSTKLTPPLGTVQRGIVTSIYAAEFASGWVLLSELARLKVDLPVEVWHRPGELEDVMIAAMKTLPLDLDIRVLEDNVSSYAIKPLSLWRSKFVEMLWIDADNVPIRDPSFLFDDPEYKIKGSLFWRDVTGVDRARFWSPDAPVWEIFNVPYNDAEEFESGQLLIDKSKCGAELALTVHFNENKDFYWRFVHGDKDTFRLAWQQLGFRRSGKIRQVNYLEDQAKVPYGFMPYGPFHVGPPNPWKKWGGGSLMQQRDRAGNPLFNHRTIFKFKLDVDASTHVDATAQDSLYVAHIGEARRLLNP